MKTEQTTTPNISDIVDKELDDTVSDFNEFLAPAVRFLAALCKDVSTDLIS